MTCGWCGHRLLTENGRWGCFLRDCPMRGSLFAPEDVQRVHGCGPRARKANVRLRRRPPSTPRPIQVFLCERNDGRWNAEIFVRASQQRQAAGYLGPAAPTWQEAVRAVRLMRRGHQRYRKDPQ